MLPPVARTGGARMRSWSRYREAIAGAVAVVAAMALVAPGAASAAKDPGPEISFKASQKTLIARDALTVRVRSERPLHLRVSARAKQGGETTRIAASGGLRVRKGKPARIRLPLNKTGGRIVQS